MDKMALSTFDDQVKKLEDILKKLKDYVSTTDKNFEGENFHPYGPHNLHVEQNTVNDIVTSMKSRYEKFRSINNKAIVMKLVNDKQVLTNITNPIKSRLASSTTKIREYAKDTSLKTALLKLEAIANAESLRFDCEQSNNCFISSDVFYIEVSLDPNGVANDVKFHGHTGQSKSCKLLLKILRDKNYKEFQCHLNGLRNRYSLNGDQSTKSTILSSLEFLEDDISKIMKNESANLSKLEIIMKCTVGYVIPKVGGKPMRLLYCYDPLSILDDKHKEISRVYTEEDPFSDDFGYSVDVLVRAYHPTMLPTTRTVSFKNKGLQFDINDSSKSQELPATFLLHFTKPLPVSYEILKSINNCLNKGEELVRNTKSPFGGLILKQFLGQSISDIEDGEYNVVLPDHTFVMRYDYENDGENFGILLTNIPFTHPYQIPQLIKILRCQALVNVLLCSCFKGSSKLANKRVNVVDACVTDWNIVTVSFIHPIDETICSIDFQVSMDGNIECSLNVFPGSPVICNNTYLNEVIGRCLSIPITLRSLYKKADTYKPELDKPKIKQTKEKQNLKPLTLNMPSVSQIQSNIPMPSPYITASPSTFMNFPSTPIFPFDSGKATTPSGRKRGSSSMATTPLGTPNSDGNRTPSKLKLPKITLKRKRNEKSEIYEIDQAKSELDMITSNEESNQFKSSANEQSSDSLSFVYSNFEGNITGKTPVTSTANPLFPDNVSFNDLTLEGESDISKLLGIPSEPFIQGTSQVTSQIQGFDLDALTSGDFDAANPNVIDPSSLLTTQTSFDMDVSTAIDIDSLMNIN